MSGRSSAYDGGGNAMPAMQSDPSQSATAYTLLVVEDDPLLRMDLSGELRGRGYTVVEAATGDEAKALLEKSSNFDLVCTDVRMPGKIDGIELTRWIKAQHKVLPCIIISGEATARLLPNVADAEFSKPLNLTQLLVRIEDLLGRYRSA